MLGRLVFEPGGGHKLRLTGEYLDTRLFTDVLSGPQRHRRAAPGARHRRAQARRRRLELERRGHSRFRPAGRLLAGRRRRPSSPTRTVPPPSTASGSTPSRTGCGASRASCAAASPRARSRTASCSAAT
ncbi:MAG: hypothetical protein WDN24_05525 [Sphingomonas sp.]